MQRDVAVQVAEMIQRGAISGATKSMTIGFDGFVDTIVRIVSDRGSDGMPTHFRQKADFGQHLVDRAAHNSSFELTEVMTKIGGNMPITAHALGRLGVSVNCVGMLGLPNPHPLFADMDPRCTLHSFAEPTQSTALEFDDGKVLLANGDALRSITWPQVRDALGIERLVALYDTSDAIGFANWGEIQHATDIWEGIVEEVLPLVRKRARLALFDLADSSRRSPADCARLAALIARVSATCETILCLNRNEAFSLHSVLCGNGHAVDVDVDAAGAGLFGALDVQTLIVRHPRAAIAWTRSGRVSADTFFVERPLLSTGGGDNFNAGYCFGRLTGLDVRQCLVLANAVAGFYVGNGDSPTLQQVAAFLQGEPPVAQLETAESPS